MSERGPGIDIKSYESKMIIGEVQKSTEIKIQETANKIIESGVLKNDLFKVESEREQKADEIIGSLGIGFDSYKNMMDAMNDPARPMIEAKIIEGFDVLRKSISVAMNSGADQELQTRINLGATGVDETLPNSWKYVIKTEDNRDISLSEAVVDVSITNPDVRGLVKKLDKVREKCDVNNPREKEILKKQIELTVENLILMDVEGEIGKSELMVAKCYLNLEVEILTGDVAKIDKADVVAVMGKAVNSEQNIRETSKTKDDVDGDGYDKKNKPKQHNRYETIEEIDNETDPKELTRIARIQLDKIEDREDLSNRYRLDGQPTWVLDEITFKLKNELIENIKNEIAIAEDGEKAELQEKLDAYELLRIEIQARLTIFDIGKLMSDAAYKLSDRGGIVEVIGSAANNNRIMDREVMGFCFRESKKAGINIPQAWNFIQDANFKYDILLKKIKDSGFANNYKGKEDFLHLDDSLIKDKGDGKPQKIGLFIDKDRNPERAKIVEDYILSELTKDEKTGKNAKKAYQLANELVSATAERSCFNFDLIKADSFADVIFFKEMRDDDARKGKNVGPVASRGIKSLTHGWLRYFSRSTDVTDKMGLIYADEVIVENIIGKEDSGGYFCKNLPSYVLPIKNALMDSDPEVKKVLNLSYLQGLVSAFDKIDIPYRIIETARGWEKTNDPTVKTKSRCGEHNMKPLYALGLLELFATKENLGMDIVSMRKLREIFVDTDLNDIAKPFLSESQWKWILEQKITHVGNKDLTFSEAMRVNDKNKIIDDFWNFFINGGKKSR